MNNLVKTQIANALQKEYLRRSFIKYFSEKGYDNFLVKPYPPVLRDMPTKLPFLNGILELQHPIEDINLADNTIKVAWNLFLLGNKRIFLGYTTHNNMSEIENGIGAIDKHHDGPISIKQIIEVMVELLGQSGKTSEISKKRSANTNRQGFGMKPYKGIPDLRRRV